MEEQTIQDPMEDMWRELRVARLQFTVMRQTARLEEMWRELRRIREQIRLLRGTGFSQLLAPEE
jgi:hypothetical protein